MKETKHTPGPWYKDICGRIWRRHPSDLYEYGGGVAGDKPIATVWRGWYGEEEAGFPLEANARLIAAAPELLEALKALLKLHDDGDYDGPDPAELALAAIAKAEGPTHETP